MIGGKNHFEADREAARHILDVLPTAISAEGGPRASFAWPRSYLAAEAGIRQFLDIGTALPTTSNVHEVAQALEPASRIVYADNDPLVLFHARALLTSVAEGRTAYIEEDLRNPAADPGPPGDPGGAGLQPARSRLIVAGVLLFVVDERQARRVRRHPGRRAAVGQLPRRLAHHPGAQPAGDRGRAAVHAQLRHPGAGRGVRRAPADWPSGVRGMPRRAWCGSDTGAPVRLRPRGVRGPVNLVTESRAATAS